MAHEQAIACSFIATAVRLHKRLPSARLYIANSGVSILNSFLLVDDPIDQLGNSGDSILNYLVFGFVPGLVNYGGSYLISSLIIPGSAYSIHSSITVSVNLIRK